MPVASIDVIDTDVVVVGAGPAGSAASITLSRAGVDVTVIDKATFPRDKCCGDGLTTLALRSLDELGLDPAVVDSWYDVDRIMMRPPSGGEVCLGLPRGRGRYASVAKRRDLDAALVELARSSGATVVEGLGLETVVPKSDHVSVFTTRGDEVRARYVIAADGMWSPTRKALGLQVDGYRGEWHGFRQYLKADGSGSRDLWVWFERDLLPGYAWSFPLPNGEVNVGFGVVRGATRTHSGTLSGKVMAETWRKLLEREHIREVLGVTEPIAPHRAWPIPARLPHMSLTGPRTLFVGDAAAATDPLTGEGIGQALETGIMAATAIIAGGATRPNTTTELYDRSARRSLASDHRASAALSTILRSPMATNAAIGAVALTGWTRRNFARWMFEDYPRAIVATPRRWRSNTFSRNGAYVRDQRSST